MLTVEEAGIFLLLLLALLPLRLLSFSLISLVPIDWLFLVLLFFLSDASPPFCCFYFHRYCYRLLILASVVLGIFIV